MTKVLHSIPEISFENTHQLQLQPFSDAPKKPKVIVEEKSVDRDYSQYSYFPVTQPNLEKYFQLHKSMFWTPQEIPYAEDRSDWEKLKLAKTTESKGIRRVIKFTLLFFVQFDGIVNENLIEHFKSETSFIKEAKNFYAVQEFMEVIHNETYSILIETLFTNPVKKAKAFNAIQEYPSIREVADWVMVWMDDSIPLPERIIAFACLEGVFFSSAFATIYWIKRKNILKGLCKANEWIARDEAIHTSFAAELYKTITSGPSRKFKQTSFSRVKEIVDSAVETISRFTKEAIRVDLVDLSGDLMVDYIKCTADTLVIDLGYQPIYKTANPFDWMSVISLPNKSNFFETRVSEYGKTTGDFTFDLDAQY